MTEPQPDLSPVTGPAFRERLSPGPAAWCAAVGLGVISGVALWPMAHVIGIVGGLLVAAGTLTALVATSPVIEVSGGVLRAGRASISLDLLGDVTTLDSAEEMRTALGPALDARAFVCLRAWARTGVRVDLDDPLDPTPYWMLSTRRPQELAAALGR